MFIDIFVVDIFWLIECLEEEVKKEYLEKLCYVLWDLAVKEGVFVYEYIGYLVNIYFVEFYYKVNKDMFEL